MNSWDMSRRDEQREGLRRKASLGALLFGALAIFVMGFVAGVWYARPHEQPSQVVQALEDNADTLRVVRAAADSVKHVDSSATAAVVAHRPAMTRASQLVDAPGQVGDSLVVVQRPAGAANDSTVADSLLLPPPIATFIREAKVQLALDSLALSVKDARITLLSRQVNLLEQRDSLHVVREHELEQQRDGAWRRGFKTGVKAVVVTAAIIGVVAKGAKAIAK